jgi:type I restriction enzyme M protein
MITGDVKNKVDRLWGTFWSNGVSNPLSVIEQISYLLFIKRLDDLEIAKEEMANTLGDPVDSPRFVGDEQQKLRWSYFRNLSNPTAQLECVRKAFEYMKQLGGTDTSNAYARNMKDAVFLITSPALIENVIKQIDTLPLDNKDTKGDLYEYMLNKLSVAGQSGQFRTPRHIIQMMVELVAPRPKDIICDPACGTAGFLVMANDYIRKTHPEVLSNEALREHFTGRMFNGYDFDPTMLRIGSMNMMLHGIENPNIISRDSLSESHAGDKESYTVILANPPFKGSVEKSGIAKDLGKLTNTTKTELLFLALFLRLLKAGGRAAVIVPDGVLFGSSKAHKSIRKELVEKHKLDAVISMPSGVFKPYSNVSTAILLFTKTGAGGTEDVWFYDMKADGLSLDDKRKDVDQNDIPDILTKWAERDASLESDRKAKDFFVSKTEIVENNYDLSINRYKEIVYEEVVYDTPLQIIDSLEKLHGEIASDLRALRGML